MAQVHAAWRSSSLWPGLWRLYHGDLGVFFKGKAMFFDPWTHGGFLKMGIAPNHWKPWFWDFESSFDGEMFWYTLQPTIEMWWRQGFEAWVEFLSHRKGYGQVLRGMAMISSYSAWFWIHGVGILDEMEVFVSPILHWLCRISPRQVWETEDMNVDAGQPAHVNNCWEYSESNLRPLAGLGHRKASYFLVSASNPFPWNPCMYIHCICIYCIYIHCIYIHCIYVYTSYIYYIYHSTIPASARKFRHLFVSVSPPFAGPGAISPMVGECFRCKDCEDFMMCASSASHLGFTLLIMGIYDDLWGFIGIYRDL